VSRSYLGKDPAVALDVVACSGSFRDFHCKVAAYTYKIIYMLLVHCHTRYTDITQIILQSGHLAEHIGGIANFQDSSCKNFSTMTLKVSGLLHFQHNDKVCGHHAGLLYFQHNDT